MGAIRFSWSRPPEFSLRNTKPDQDQAECPDELAGQGLVQHDHSDDDRPYRHLIIHKAKEWRTRRLDDVDEDNCGQGRREQSEVQNAE